MKRKILTAALVLAMSAVAFTGCGSDDNDTPAITQVPTTTPEATTTTAAVDTTAGATVAMSNITRGTWENGVWSSEYLGISFNLPEGWVTTTDAEMAANLSLGMDIFDLGVELDDFQLLPDMGAQDPMTGDNVQVLIERLDPAVANITAAEYAELASMGIEMLGGEVTFGHPSVTIGGQEWYVVGTFLDFGGGIAAAGRQLINVEDGFARLIIITHMTDDASNTATMYDIIANFN